MRAIVVHPGPAYSVADVHHGWMAGLTENGVNTAEYNLGDRIAFYCNASLEIGGETRNVFDTEAGIRLAIAGLEAACFRWWPDLVIVISGFFVPPETFEVIRARGMRVVLVHTESPYEDDAQLLRAPAADLNVLNDPTNIDAFTTVAPTIYLPHAHDPELHRPRSADPKLASDFFFVGTGYPSRIEFLNAVDFTGVDVKLAGNWQSTPEDSWLRDVVVHDIDDCIFNDEAQGFYTSTKMSANLYRRESNRPDLSAGWAMGPREVELAASGTFFLREPRGEGDEVFPTLPTFTTPDEFSDLMRWWLAHDTERQAAADQARQAVQDRTFANHTAQVLRTLDHLGRVTS